MSLLKFELKEEHIKLLKHIKFTLKDNVITSVNVDEHGFEMSPFGGDDLIEDIHIILEGVNDKYIKNKIEDLTINETERYDINDDLKIKYQKLYDELPTALDIILFNSNFNVGNFKTKWYDRNWVKIK